LFCILTAVAGYARQDAYAEIKGKVQSDKLKEVKLYSVEAGRSKLLASTTVSADGSYGFLFVPAYTGFYTISADEMHHSLYIKPGDEVNLSVFADKAELYGENTSENTDLYQWLEASNTVRKKSTTRLVASNYEDFFPDLEVLVNKLPGIRQNVRSVDPSFKAAFESYLNYELDFMALSFLCSPRAKHPTKEQWTPFYRTIDPKQRLSSELLLNYPKGVTLLNLYLTFYILSNGDTQVSANDLALSLIPAPVLKGEYIKQALNNLSSYEAYQSFIDKYGQYLITPSQQEEAAKAASKLYDLSPGKEAADFSYPDVDGKTHSLSEYRGKVVLLDIWATWCGPCRKEFPALKKLATEMHNSDLLFLGISIDAPKDKKRWAEMIASEALPCVQLLAGPDQKFSDSYKINSIPRYIVIDKKGNIVSNNAPRPSDEALKIMLEKALKDK
jgi:peroxiredoxin